MTTDQKIEAIKEAIEKAKNLQSKMDATAWAVPALSSLRIRHLMNNLGSISTSYLECGVHRGGLFCSTIRNNPNLKNIVANDSFASDATTGESIESHFFANVTMCAPKESSFTMLLGDTFGDLPSIVGLQPPIDLYLFDADHSYESQRKAMTHFLPAMADEFIVCVDDYDWEDVCRGTQAGIEEANVDILFEDVWKGNDHDNDGAWNGFYIALLKKK